jgi:hypothetical protein
MGTEADLIFWLTVSIIVFAAGFCLGIVVGAGK